MRYKIHVGNVHVIKYIYMGFLVNILYMFLVRIMGRLEDMLIRDGLYDILLLIFFSFIYKIGELFLF
jgi:hypothetical protein